MEFKPESCIVASLRFFTGVGFLAVAFALQAAPLDLWHVRSVTSPTNQLWGVAYGNGRYVAVGDCNGLCSFVQTSTDGVNWTERSFGAEGVVLGVAYGNGLFVAVGSSRILASADGSTWVTNRTVPTLLRAITFAEGQFVTVGGGASWTSILSSPDGTNWTDHPLSTTNELYSVTYGNGLFVAVGPTGLILTSSDGTEWTVRDSHTTGYLRDIAYGNGQFVVTGEDYNSQVANFPSIFLTSNDGTNWVVRAGAPAPFGSYLSAIAFGGGKFVMPAYGKALSSTNGINWVVHNLATNGINTDVVFANDMFLTVGDAIQQSDPLSDTLPIITPPLQNKTVTVGGETSFSITALGTSPFSYRWFKEDAPIADATNTALTLSNVQFSDAGKYSVAVSNRVGITTSSPPAMLTVEAVAVPSIDDHPQSQTATRGAFVRFNVRAVGNSPLSYQWRRNGIDLPGATETMLLIQNVEAAHAGSYSVVVSSSAGSVTSQAASLTVQPAYLRGLDHWHNRASPVSAILSSVIYAQGMFVAVGELTRPLSDFGVILTSTNGIDWTVRSTSGTTSLADVTYANGAFVAVGWIGRIYVSSDGINWGAINSGRANSLSSVAYGDGMYVAVGYGGSIQVAFDFAFGDWFDNSSSTAWSIVDLTYKNGTFVAVAQPFVAGTHNFVGTLNDLYTSRGLGELGPGVSVEYGHGKWVVVGQNGSLQTSTNLTEWTTHDSGTTRDLWGVVHSAGIFVAVGSNGAIVTSTNGVDWVRRDSITQSNLYSVAFGRGTFVAVGAGGTIVQSDPLFELALTYDASAKLRLTGPLGLTYRIEARNDLDAAQPWASLTTVTLTNSPQTWTDVHSANHAKRVYRAVLP